MNDTIQNIKDIKRAIKGTISMEKRSLLKCNHLFVRLFLSLTLLSLALTSCSSVKKVEEIAEQNASEEFLFAKDFLRELISQDEERVRSKLSPSLSERWNTPESAFQNPFTGEEENVRLELLSYETYQNLSGSESETNLVFIVKRGEPVKQIGNRQLSPQIQESLPRLKKFKVFTTSSGDGTVFRFTRSGSVIHFNITTPEVTYESIQESAFLFRVKSKESEREITVILKRGDSSLWVDEIQESE